MMAAVVIAIAHVPYQKNILTRRAVFANHLPRIGVLSGNSDSTGCVCGGREEYVIILSFFYTFMVLFCNDTGLFSPCRRYLRSICREWHLTFLLCYHVQCITHMSLTPVLRGQSITNAPRITQSTQVPHVSLKTLSRQTTKNASEC